MVILIRSEYLNKSSQLYSFDEINDLNSHLPFKKNQYLHLIRINICMFITHPPKASENKSVIRTQYVFYMMSSILECPS